MRTAEEIKTFVTAGRAVVTLKSKKTGTRYTYKVRRVPDSNRFFVSLLSGPDNTSNYSYIGLMECNSFRTTAKSNASDGTPSVQAFKYFCKSVMQQATIPEALEVHHEGKCGKCGRALTVPESIERGIGPECWSKMGGA